MLQHSVRTDLHQAEHYSQSLQGEYFTLKNSLIIHEENTKKMNV
jgi:hypothetical protein